MSKGRLTYGTEVPLARAAPAKTAAPPAPAPPNSLSA